MRSDDLESNEFGAAERKVGNLSDLATAFESLMRLDVPELHGACRLHEPPATRTEDREGVTYVRHEVMFREHDFSLSAARLLPCEAEQMARMGNWLAQLVAGLSDDYGGTWRVCAFFCGRRAVASAAIGATTQTTEDFATAFGRAIQGSNTNGQPARDFTPGVVASSGRMGAEVVHDEALVVQVALVEMTGAQIKDPSAGYSPTERSVFHPYIESGSMLRRLPEQMRRQRVAGEELIASFWQGRVGKNGKRQSTAGDAERRRKLLTPLSPRAYLGLRASFAPNQVEVPERAAQEVRGA